MNKFVTGLLVVNEVIEWSASRLDLLAVSEVQKRSVLTLPHLTIVSENKALIQRLSGLSLLEILE